MKFSDPDLEAAVRHAKSGDVGQRGKVKGDRVGHNADNEGPWELGSFTAAELQCMQFPPISWIVPNIIPAEGVTLLCSKPKFGKSWFAYDLCISCTMERFTLGTIKPAQGDVLYLALEDSKRRLHGRMSKLLPTGVMWPEALTLKTEWRRLHEGGVDDIRDWHTHTKSKGGRPILVVIDVLAKVRKPVGNRQLYEADYAALADLTKLANELGLAIVVVHHTRKMAADDLMEMVSGSYGVSGAVDTILVMATKASGTVLDIRGRDVESAELAIEFNKNTCRWRVLGNAADVHVSEQRAKIIAALKEVGQPMTIAALVEATHMKRNPLEVLLSRMTKDGEIKRLEKGHYAHKDYIPIDDPPKGNRSKPPRRSVASVPSSRRPTDSETERRSVQESENKGTNPGICPSVAPVHENPDTNGARASGPTQTDRTDGQMGAEAADRPAKFSSADLSGNLSGHNHATDDRQPNDDFPELPASLRRAPITVTPDRGRVDSDQDPPAAG
jgi:hypothetical protein